MNTPLKTPPQSPDKVKKINFKIITEEGEKNELLSPRSLKNLKGEYDQRNEIGYSKGQFLYASLTNTLNDKDEGNGRVELCQKWIKHNFNIMINLNTDYNDPLLKSLKNLTLKKGKVEDNDLNDIADKEWEVSKTKPKDRSEKMLKEWGIVVIDAFKEENDYVKEWEEFNQESIQLEIGKKLFESITRNEKPVLLSDALKKLLKNLSEQKHLIQMAHEEFILSVPNNDKN